MKSKLRLAARAGAVLAASVGASVCAIGSAFAADAFVLDASHTFVQFSVNRFGYNAVIGHVPGVKGTVVLDRENPGKSSVEATIDLSSLVSFDATRDEHLKGPFWFNVEKFATIAFVSKELKLRGENEADVIGALTLHGVEKPVTLHVALNKRGPDPATKKEAVGFSVVATLKRSDFGMTTAQGMVGDEVAIRIEALAHLAQ